MRRSIAEWIIVAIAQRQRGQERLPSGRQILEEDLGNNGGI